jgi:hypothetical protein
MTPLCLIQLISEQTIQNLLPIHALQPTLLVHLATEKTAHRAVHIKDAALVSGLDAQFETIRLSLMPSIAETARRVKHAVEVSKQEGMLPIVNFTGGTKLMSIGAYQEAAKQQVASFYVDAQSGQFLDGETGAAITSVFGNDLSFSTIIARLTLDMMVVANGHQSVSAGREWSPLLPAAQALMTNTEDAQALSQTVLKQLPDPNGKNLRPADWLAVLDTPFSVPPTLLAPLCDAGILRPCASPEKACLPEISRELLQSLSQEKNTPDFFTHFDRAKLPLAQARNFITGSWWEVIVVHSMERSGRFQDLRWSADITQQSGAKIEEDILALNGADAVCVSCKTGGAGKKLLPHLEELSARSRAVGGAFTRTFLAVQRLLQRNEASIVSRARELRIRLLTPENINHPESFD